jgi:hypothetical protein
VGDTPSIAAAVIDSLPDGLPYLLVSQTCPVPSALDKMRGYFVNDLSLGEHDKTDFVLTIERLRSLNSRIFLIPVDDSAYRIVHSTLHRLGVSLYPMPDSGSFEKWQFHWHFSKLGVRVPKASWLKHKAKIDFERLCSMLGLPLF